MKRCEACGELNHQDAQTRPVCKTKFTETTGAIPSLRGHESLGDGNYRHTPSQRDQ